MDMRRQLCDSIIKSKRPAILFYKKKVVPFNFGFDSLGNESNFLSNQKAGKLMNVTRNKLLSNEDEVSCLGHNIVPKKRFEPTTLRSRVLHSTN